MSHHTADPVCPLCEEKLTTAHAYMADWFRKVKALHPDIHVSWAYRGEADQEEFFREGKTRCHYPNSAHNRVSPDTGQPESYAIDIFQIDADHPAGFWDGVFCAKINAENSADSLPILWGGTFKHLGDNDHFQYNP